MATYEEIYGKRVKEFDSDPTLESSYEGQVWYDKSSGTLRSVVSFGAWRSGGNLTVPRSLGGISGGTQTTSLAYAGYLGIPGNSNSTEEYNGTGWGSGGNVNTARRGGAGLGIQTAALLAGGYSTSPTTFVEEYNGSSWSEVTNTPADMGAGAGTQTAALTFSGTTALYYDGTNWTSSTALPTAMTGATGLQTAALAVIPPPSGTTTLEWDGSSWTTGGSYNTARPSGLGGMTSGIQTSAITAGGPAPGIGGITEQYDGTSWATSSGTQGTPRNSYMTSAANNTAALIAGGSPYTTATEEFTQSINTITAAAWSSGGTYPYAAANLVSLGPATGMLSCGGNNSGPTKQTTVTLYNGTSYSSETAMPVAANGMGQGKGGTETAGLIFGGSTPGGNTTATILYNGSSWTSGGALSTARRNLGGLGISTAALAFGGQEPSYSTATEEYGGSSWTAGGALPAARRNATGVGSQTAGLVLAGQSPPGAGVNTSFTYNGTSYSGGPTMINSRSDGAASGPNSSNTSALVYGGTTGSPNYTVILPAETYDGSSFSTAPSLSTGRDGQGSGASATEGVQVAGYVPSDSYLSATEQFTPESTAVTASTLTSS